MEHVETFAGFGLITKAHGVTFPFGYERPCPKIALQQWVQLGTVGAMQMQKIKTVIYLEPEEREALERLSKKTGAPLTELARRAIAAYIKQQTKDTK